MRLTRYFANLRAPKLVLWCYLAWYGAVAGYYFDPSPAIWLSAVGISGVFGIALNFASGAPGQRSDRWT